MGSRLRFISVTALWVLLFSMASANASESLMDYTLENGDGLRLLIYDGKNFPQENNFLYNFHNVEYILDGEGYIRLGSLGVVRVGGLTVKQAGDAILAKLRPFAKEPRVVVIPLMRIVLRGEFRAQGMYRISPNSSFWDAVALGGGTSSYYQIEDMYIIRDGDLVFTNFIEAVTSGTSLAEMGIESGDEIVAPRVNRLNFNNMMTFVNFLSSLVLLYVTLSRE